MGSKRKSEKSRTDRKKRRGIALEYYQIPFVELHAELGDAGAALLQPHILRTFYWSSSPQGIFGPKTARQLISGYLLNVERKLTAELSQHSLAYWLHSYRRLLPAAAGKNDDPSTVMIVRFVLEGAIQKSAQLGFCQGIGISDQVAPEKILSGKLMQPVMDLVRKRLSERPQLVLTNFGRKELIDLYLAEKLAYELWRCGATLRILAKGADLVVDASEEPQFYDNRSDELHRLVTIYDKRPRPFGTSATGTSYPHDFGDWESSGGVFVPQYNVEQIPAEKFSPLFYRFGVEFSPNLITNFVWLPVNLRGYYKAHIPFRDAFRHKHGLTYDSVMVVVATLLARIFVLWTEKQEAVLHYWQRAYEGPVQRDLLLKEIAYFLPAGLQLLASDVKAADIDVSGAMNFLELKSGNRHVDVLVGSPLKIFLPLDQERIFVDFAWIPKILYNLFFGLNPPDQNFKGDALEEVLRHATPPLPHTQIRTSNGEARQVDASFSLEGTLIIVECRAFARSFGIEKGDPKSYIYRRERIEAALRDVDSKAEWLSRNPVGRNYDIRSFTKILPVAVTPFVEYIHSTDPYYWLTEELPRVLTPTEFKTALEDGTLKKAAERGVNGVKVARL